MINYHTLGGGKRLCDIVFAGSHDAGITGGDANVQTQDLEIFEQAKAGVRLFDLRIAATKSSTLSSSPVMLKAFHADPKLMHQKDKKDKTVFDLGGRKADVTTTKLPLDGAFGMRLVDMLQQAKDFVKYNTSEFLLLKFDKCTNWAIIAEICVRELGAALFTGTGSLNEKTLDQLKKHVVVLFTQKGIDEVAGQGYLSSTGIWGCKRLADGTGYSSGYDGLQYVGKGGTNALNGDSDMGKIASNIEKQSGLMQIGALNSDPEVMGMMYWTTTGLKRSIRERNSTMWGPDNRPTALTELWMAGFGEAIESRLPTYVSSTDYTNGVALKVFMPNIVMIDFADIDKGKFIFELNMKATTELTQTARKIEQARKLAQGQGGGRRQQRAGLF
ncbi:hypothetical protein [Paraburkholderia hospita]|jgi:hypothetical protein|uniref:hypothetical protein n=1 Tax=Paraburkholderia hospita TaxID=169430 RepID=UPI000271A4E0|nr:hypothetical protein [Paraburkholderia hospita]EUC16046.1 hypothetical protein PMI06_005437 [Burkholderia sp. BT03]OUL69375.1 hypothetical protein CA603_50905 [Paraburkholderia hospita]SKC81254.1 hypothetical protein SAMN06266956_3720 [Paraburkholderia hospita]SKC84775.1 hypothetical protein SAMN05445504_4227 [Burkholderia sp. CF099]